MFIDRAKIKIKGGNGGNGCVSFYRAKYITNGGPDGGDGGRGGDIIFVADRGVNNLIDFRHKRTYKAESGQDGSKGNSSGKDGADIVIKVPVGTVIREAVSNKIMADLAHDGDKKTIIKGGRGGRGNQHYATPTMQAPRYAQGGQTAKEYELILELKLIADVGLVGFPNVGKSSLLMMVTNANPKIGNYHFTTLSPNLGVVVTDWGKNFVLADIPGLIEGAHQGLGLGHEFLRHIERTKVLIHVVDAAALEGGDPLEDIKKINDELFRYNPKLRDRPQVIAANKTDIPEAAENVARIKAEYDNVFPISAATGDGLNDLIMAVAKILEDYPKDIVFEEDFEEYQEIEVDAEPYTITITDEGAYAVEGTGIEKMLGYTSLDTEKGFNFFQKYLRDKGIIDELTSMGINEGDTVRLYNLEFEFYK